MTKILTFIFLISSVGIAIANQTIVIPFGYVEPDKNANGSKLEDLSHTELYLKDGAGDKLIATIPASSKNGGAEIVQDVTITLPQPTKPVTFMTFYAVAVDLPNKKGERNTSEKSSEFTFPIVTIVEKPQCEECPACEECKPCPDVVTKITSTCNCGVNACRCVQCN